MRRFALLTLLAFGALVGTALPAHADDDKVRGGKPIAAKARQDFLSALTDAERTYLRKNVKGWETLPPEKQQRMAQNVIRMRTMTEAEKKRLQGHIKRLKRQRGAGGSSDRRRGHHNATWALVGRALSREARRTLGRDFERELRRRDISDHAFETSFGRTFWRKLSEKRAAAGEPLAADALPADFPDSLRKKYAQDHAKYLAAEEGSKTRATFARRLHFKLAMHKGERFRAQVRSMDLKGDAQLDAIAASIRKQWPEALEQSLEDPDALIRGAEKYELSRSIRRLLMRTERLEREELALVASLLNRLSMHHRKKKGDAEDRAASDELLKRILERDLRVPAEKLEGLPSADDPEARLAFLAGLARYARVRGLGGMHAGMHGSKKGGPHGRGSHDGRSHDGRSHDGRSHEGRGMRRGMPRLEQPEGVSDADWAIYVKARDAAFEAKDFAALRQMMQVKPEGMTDAGYRAVREALKARMNARGDGGMPGGKGEGKGGGRKGRRGPR